MLNATPMLAGLIFAIEEAEDRPGTLVATLPFGGMTLLEYQIRLLAGVGAAQVMVAVGRVTPPLLAAVERTARLDIDVQIVRSAEEAAEKVAADAQVLVMADGLVTVDPVIDQIAGEPHEALLVTDDAESPAAIERLDMHHCWGGVARISTAQLGQIAQMPDDYDFQSALLRVAAQSGAEHVPIDPRWLRGSHSVERNAEGLALRNTGVLAALSERRDDWADRWVFSRAARLALPELVARDVTGWAPVALGGVLGLGAVGAAVAGWLGVGAIVALFATAVLAIGVGHAALRGEERRARRIELGVLALFVLLILASGWREHLAVATATALVIAGSAVAFQVLIERVPARPRRWWASPSAQLILFAPFALAGHAVFGLGAVTVYALATLAAAIEATRQKP
ncbi:hypothetical protein ACX40Y_08395 [Sphingomonas sp. RS6]